MHFWMDTIEIILVVKNMFRFLTAKRYVSIHLALLTFPSRKGQNRRVKTGLNGIMESEHIYDIRYKWGRVPETGGTIRI